MAAICRISFITPRTSPAPRAPVPACGLELALSSTAFPKKTLPPTVASAVRKTTSGELAPSPAGSIFEKGNHSIPVIGGFLPQRMSKNYIQLQINLAASEFPLRF